MKILVTGASGLLGLNLCLMQPGGHVFVGVDRGRLSGMPIEIIHTDLLDPHLETRLFDGVRPDAIIHTAANASLDACEADPQGARLINAELPGRLAHICARRDVRFMHISTDAVFDGAKEGSYTEDDTPNPLSVYARTKLDGERNVLSANRNASVARVNFFGWSLSGTRSLSEFFFNNLSAGKPCNGFTDVWFCPMFVGDLGEALMRMLERGLSGLYHVVGSAELTKYEFGVGLSQQFGFDSQLVIPRSVEESGLKARRSHNLRLSVNKLSTDLGLDIPGVSTGIKRFYTQAQQGYPQKLRGYQQS